MEVPHDESTTLGIEVEYDAGWAQTFESQSSDRIAESDVAEETMSVMGKLAKDPLEPHDIDQPTAECQLMTPVERRLVTKRDELRPVQGRAEDPDERVMTSHTETCEGCEVTSVKEGHDVERVIVAKSDETANILKQLKNETSADLTALEKKGLDRKTSHQELVKAEMQPRRQGHHLGETSSELVSQVRGQKTVAHQRRVKVMACILVLGARGFNPRRGEEFPPLFGRIEQNESSVTRQVHGCDKRCEYD